jgi:hypothetical protein
MRMVRLLTAGKSLVGSKDGTVRYQMSDPRAMPKFGSAKNLFREAAKGKGGEVGDKGAAGGTPAPLLTGGTPAPLTEGAKTVPARGITRSPASVLQQAVTAQRTESGKVPLRPKNATPQPGGISRMVGKVRRLISGSRGPAAKAGIPQIGKPAVQAELSLEKIKVVRNDLSDTDLEVVTIQKPTAESRAEPAGQRLERTEPAETAWGRVASRFFGADKT